MATCMTGWEATGTDLARQRETHSHPRRVQGVSASLCASWDQSCEDARSILLALPSTLRRVSNHDHPAPHRPDCEPDRRSGTCADAVGPDGRSQQNRWRTGTGSDDHATDGQQSSRITGRRRLACHRKAGATSISPTGQRRGGACTGSDARRVGCDPAPPSAGACGHRASARACLLRPHGRRDRRTTDRALA